MINMGSGPSGINTVIDIGSLTTFVESKMECNQFRMSPLCCIFRTPSILARHKREAYIPNCFSFGPFHHGQPNLIVAEKIKLRYLRGLLSRSHIPGAMLSECLRSVNEAKGKARDCYADFDLSEPTFVEMLVVDGCFIIELFRKAAAVVPKENDDPVFSMSFMLQFLHHDLILLENQVPWLVLELLFDKTKAPCEKESLLELALRFFLSTCLYPRTLVEPNGPNLFANQNVRHILDLLRLSLVLPSDEVKQYEMRGPFNRQHKTEWHTILPATRLAEAGVKFVRVKANSILDIKFKHGVLEIPPLLIQETTETIFRNLISYEQCLPNCKPVFTSYAKIMDNLTDTIHDVEILCKKDVFGNWLSPEDATQFFNKLYNDTYMKDYYYSDLCIELDRHCQNWLPKWRAAYVQNYFAKPWVIVAQIYAFMIFVLTCWQTFKN